VNAWGGDSLSLSDCFERAEAYSFRLEESSQRTISARGALEQKKTVAKPEIYVDGGGNAEFLSPYNFQQAWLLMRVDWSLGDLFMKTSLYNENRVLALQAEQEQVRLKLMQRIALLYMSILQNDVQIRLFKERLNLLQGHLLMANALWEAGTQSEIDVLQTRTEITKIQEQVVSVQVQRDNLKLEIAKLMGIQQLESFRLVPVQLADLEVQRMPQWVDTLIARHPLIRTLDFQILAENEKGRNIRAEQFPRLNMQTGYVSDADPTADGNYWQIMGGLSVPVFRWGRSNYQKQQLKADIQTLLMQREDVKRELTIHINQVLERLDKYRDLYLKQLQRLDYSEQAYNLADIHYRAGLITNLEYLTLQEQFTETQISLQETKLKYGLNLVEFYVVTGQTDHLNELYLGND
jgi:outer membrane protein TolC